MDKIYKLLDRVGFLADKAYQEHLKAEEAAGQPVAFNISKEAEEVIASFSQEDVSKVVERKKRLYGLG
ncbi:hypothetical protein GZ77_09250 [Endozoicomonas montiporae]|uniref:Uncharacterized protein n=2 Tax=Endozoicomonas montiporae TaxID=1027273 RepID=A0A081N7U7_9GAMM|nr:hypothetical protein GZ77_09250 [Endozoicomonas montiporae]